MDRPKEAIERLRQFCANDFVDKKYSAILAYLDWLEGKHVCEWPKELTRERLDGLAKHIPYTCETGEDRTIALRALAAIAPQRKKRVVNLWEWEYDKTAFGQDPKKTWIDDGAESPGRGWRKVAGPIEIED